MPRSSKLSSCIALLARHHPHVGAPPARTRLQWILWEIVAYLVDDARRLTAYRELERKVGLRAEDLACASRPELLAVARLGGMQPERRVDTLLAIAELAVEQVGGDLSQLLALSAAKARAALKRYPGIGAPGAEKILMLCGASRALALESNGLRVLLRIGYGREDASYARAYRSVEAALEPELEDDSRWLCNAHELLRLHGQTVCRRSDPDCGACPLAPCCDHALRAS